MAQRILYCFILGDILDNVFPVIIGERTRVDGSDVLFKYFTVGVLKKYLIESNDRLSGILNIWKVEGVTEGSKKWNILNEKYNTEIIIEQELGGDKLSSAMKHITELYPEQPPIGIDIIVQPATGKCLPTFYISFE